MSSSQQSDQGTSPVREAPGMTRGQFAARCGGAVFASSAFAALVAACGGSSDGETSASGSTSAAGTAASAETTGGTATATASESIGGTLTLLTYSGYESPEAAKPFVEENDVTVRITALASPEEILTKLKAGGTSTFDLVSPNVVGVADLVAADVVAPLDFSRLPNTEQYLPYIAQLAEDFAVDGTTYVAPYIWGINALVYDTTAVPTAPASWLDLTGAEFEKKIGLYDFAFDNYYTWSRVKGYDPYKLTSEQLDEVTDFIIELKENQARTFTNSFDDLADQLARGDITAVGTAIWVAVVGMAQEKGGNGVAWSLPSEGGGTWVDGWTITPDPPNPDAAYAWLNYMLGPEAQAIVAPALLSATVNSEAVALLPPEARDAYPYDDEQLLVENAPPLQYLPLTRDDGFTGYDDWVAAWARVQAA